MKRENFPPAVPSKDYLLKRLGDPATAAAYLSATVEDDDPRAFLQALRNVTEAQGGIGKVADLSGLNRQQLYRTLSDKGNPELRSLLKILSVSGLRLEVTAKPRGARSKARSTSRIASGAAIAPHEKAA